MPPSANASQSRRPSFSLTDLLRFLGPLGVFTVATAVSLFLLFLRSALGSTSGYA